MVMGLIRQLRIDKNGKAVNRLVRPSDDSTEPAPALPAPVVPVVQTAPVLSPRELTDGIKARFVKESSFIPLQASSGIFEMCTGPERRHVEKLYRISASFEYRDASYFRTFLGGSLEPPRARHRLIAAIESFDFCAALEDAVPNATGRESRSMDRTVLSVVDHLPAGALNEVHFGDISASYFMQRVGFDSDKCFGNKADYYRAMEQVRQNLDTIQPYLPAIIALTWDGKSYDTADKLFGLIDDLSQHPPEKVPLILNVVRDRGGYDRAVVDEALELGVGAISSGVL
jgi:hypothetical protein